MGYKASDGRTYSSASAASRANARMASAPKIGSSSSSSSSSTSKGGSSSSKGSSSSSSGGTYKYNPTTGYYERTDGGTNTYTGKGGSTVTVGGGKVTTTGGSGGGSSRTVTGGYMQNGKLYNEYSDGTTGLASESGGAGSKGNTSKLSSNISSNSNVGEKKKEDYTASSWENYTNAYNHYKEQGMSDADARTQASAFLENENLLGGNKKEDIAVEQQNNNDDEDARLNDVMGDLGEEQEEEEPYSYDFDELFGDWADRYEKRIADLESQLESQSVKTSIPEEKDTTYDYNTYFNQNLADQTQYAGGQTQDVKQEGLTFAERYEEPVTNALSDLGLLTPNEEAATEEGVIEEQTPTAYNSGDEIISEFNNTIEQMGQDGAEVSPKQVAQTYVDYKNKLDDYVNNNKISPEEYKTLLAGLRQNQLLNKLLKRQG